MFKTINLNCLIALMLLLNMQLASAHAFPEQSTPGAGSELSQAPTSVTICFNKVLEPVFSKLIVKNEQDEQVSRDNGTVDSAKPEIISTQLDEIQPGLYHVYWSVVSRDGHRTQGDYTFTVK